METNNFYEYADGTTSDFSAGAPEYSVDYGLRDPMAPVYPGPVITAPPISGAPVTVIPSPVQFPLAPHQYPAYYDMPIQYPYPMRGFDAAGDEVEVRFFPLPGPFFPGPFFPGPRPYFYPPRPFIYPIPPVPPFFI